jgi:tartrate dehydrogenase/decarboxylase/D-malate dehydrogenase
MNTIHLAVVPGDGVGIEVMREARKVLDRLAELHGGVAFSYDSFDWGCQYYLRTGRMMSEDGMARLEASDAILLGAIGFPGVPDHVSLHGLLLRIRREFDQYVNLRPVRLLDSRDCPLRGVNPPELDMVFVRENTEGEYAGIGGRLHSGTADEAVLQTAVFTRKGTERVMRYAFELARSRASSRRAAGRKAAGRLTSVTKSNALNHSMVFWDEVFAELKPQYPDVETFQYHVDAAGMYLLQRPADFDVVVASNLFGDILTDLGAALQGGLGLAAGADLNPEKAHPSMFEPVHGSAPDIAGRGWANPLAMIWTLQLMLDFLGYPQLAARVMAAVEAAVVHHHRELTRDMGGSGSTSSVGDLVVELLEQPR